MTKSEQGFFNQWKKNGLKALANKPKKATKAQQKAWDEIINGER